MNVISFSLWGSAEKYVRGAEENFKLQPLIYPGWKVRLYCDQSVPADARKKFAEQYGVDVRLIGNGKGSFYGTSWRFRVHDDDSVDYFIVRDCDSRLNWRERAAVDEWISTGKTYHFMRDHPQHQRPIQSGMWGGRVNALKIIPLIDLWPNWGAYGDDETFLSCIYPFIRTDSCVHDPYYEKIPFPAHQIEENRKFVGEQFDF